MARTGGSNWRVFASLEAAPYKKELKEIGVETRQFATKSQQDWKRVGNQLSGLTGRLGQMGRSMTGMFSGMSAGAGAATAAILGISVAVGAVTTAVSTSKRAWEAYADIDIARRRTGAAAMGLGGSADYRRGMATQIGERISREWGISEDQVQVALRDIMGLDPASWQEAEELLVMGIKEFYTSQTAIAQTASVLKGTSNVWDKTTKAIADELTTIVQKAGGQTVLGTAARAAQYYMPAAQQAGVQSDFAGALFAALTQFGAGPEQAGTRAKAIFTELGDPTKGLGKVIAERTEGRDIADLDSMELASIMAAAYQALGAHGMTGSSEAQLGLLPFQEGRVDKVLEYIEALQDSAGAFDKVTGEVTESSKIETNKFSQLWRDFWKKWGEAISPEFTSRMKDFSASIQAWMNSEQFKSLAANIGKVSAEIVKLGAVVLPILLKGITDLLDKITSNKKLFGIIGGALETLFDVSEAALEISPFGVARQGYRMSTALFEGDMDKFLENFPAFRMLEHFGDFMQMDFRFPEMEGTQANFVEKQREQIDLLNSINMNTKDTADEAGRGADASEGTEGLLEGEKDRAFFFAPFSIADNLRQGV